MIATEYLVEMKFPPNVAALAPAEAVAFAERIVLPTLEQCQRLVAAGRIVGGGPATGTMAFAFILRAESPQQVDETVTALPAWPRAQTTVTPLATFDQRMATARERIAAAARN